MAAWERQSDTRNPLDQLIAKESRTCKGCRFHLVEVCFSRKVELCRLGRKKVRKCGMYGEKS